MAFAVVQTIKMLGSNITLKTLLASKISPLKLSKAGKSEITPVNTQGFVQNSATYKPGTFTAIKITPVTTKKNQNCNFKYSIEQDRFPETF